MAVYGFSSAWVGDRKVPRYHNLYRADHESRLVFLGCILMLFFPSFIQASIQIGEIAAESEDDGHAIIHRSINVFLNPANRASIYVAGDSGTACKLSLL
jgi:hypothetical protein